MKFSYVWQPICINKQLKVENSCVYFCVFPDITACFNLEIVIRNNRAQQKESPVLFRKLDFARYDKAAREKS